MRHTYSIRVHVYQVVGRRIRPIEFTYLLELADFQWQKPNFFIRFKRWLREDIVKTLSPMMEQVHPFKIKFYNLSYLAEADNRIESLFFSNLPAPADVKTPKFGSPIVLHVIYKI